MSETFNITFLANISHMSRAGVKAEIGEEKHVDFVLKKSFQSLPNVY